MEQLLGDNPLVSLLVAITGCQSRLGLAGVKLLQICIFAFGHDVHTFAGAMRSEFHVG